MARTTIKSLQLEIATIQAAYAQLAAAHTALVNEVHPMRYQPPKGACVVLVNGVPRASALSHSAAYQLMQSAKARGHKALYRPYH